jgi:hypothetical protein
MTTTNPGHGTAENLRLSAQDDTREICHSEPQARNLRVSPDDGGTFVLTWAALTGLGACHGFEPRDGWLFAAAALLLLT